MLQILSKLNLVEDEKLNIVHASLLVTLSACLIWNDLLSCISFSVASATLCVKWWIGPIAQKKASATELDEVRDKIQRVSEQLTQTRMAIGFKAK